MAIHEIEVIQTEHYGIVKAMKRFRQKLDRHYQRILCQLKTSTQNCPAEIRKKYRTRHISSLCRRAYCSFTEEVRTPEGQDQSKSVLTTETCNKLKSWKDIKPTDKSEGLVISDKHDYEKEELLQLKDFQRGTPK